MSSSRTAKPSRRTSLRKHLLFSGTALCGALAIGSAAGASSVPTLGGGLDPTAGGAAVTIPALSGGVGAQVAGGGAALPTYQVGAGSTTGTIALGAARTIIDWNTYAVSGAALTYTGAANAFVVNRLAAGQLSVDGTSSVNAAGLNIWFLAPNGVLLNGTVTAQSVVVGQNLDDAAFLAAASPDPTLVTSGPLINLISSAGTVTATGIELDASGNITLTGDIDVDTGAAGSSAAFTAAGTITQSAGVITADSLSASAVGGLSLTDANVVNTVSSLSNTTSGDIALTVANASGVTFSGAVSNTGGGDVALVNSLGNLSLAGVTSDGAAAVTATGGFITLGGDITTAGGQTYHSAVVLGADVTLHSTGSGAIDLTSTLDGSHALSANTAGLTTFGGAVGASTMLSSLTVQGPAAINGGATNTTGSQTFSGAVTLGADTTLTGSQISFASSVDSDSTARTLTVTGDGVFDGVVGGLAPLTALSVSGTTSIGADITTTGDQTYSDVVTLAQDATLAGAAIDFASTINGAQNLTVNATGLLTFGGAVGGVMPLASLTASWGTITLSGNVTTTGNQTYNSALTLSRDQTFTSTNPGTVSFASTVNGAHALTVTGNASFGGAVGGGTALTSVSVSGTTALGADVSTSGGQTYSDAVTLTGDASLTSTAGALDFVSTVDGAANLTVNANGLLTFGGAVGGTTPLTSLTATWGTLSLGGDVATSGDQTYNSAVILTRNQSFTSSAGLIDFTTTVSGAYALTASAGSTLIFGDTVGVDSLSATGSTISLSGDVTTAGGQTYNSPVTLESDRILTSTASGDIDFASTVNGSHALTVSTGGALTFGGAVGGSSALTSLAATGTGISVGGNVTTSGDQTYTGAVTLTGDAVLHATAAGAIDFTSTVDGGQALTVNTTGAVTFGDAVGGVTPLTSLTATWGSVTLSGDVTTTGGQTYNSALTLTRDQSFVSTGAGAIDFASTIDGAYVLTANAAGVLTFGGTVGGGTALTSLSATGSSISLGADVATTGGQTYASPLTLGANVTLHSTASGDIGFNATVDGGHLLTVNTGGGVTFGDVVGGTTPLSGLDVTGASISIGGDVSTSGDQSYAGAVTLTGDATVTGGAIDFTSTVDGGQALTISASGLLTFGDAVGGVTPLTSLTATWGSIALGGDVTTTGAQTYYSPLTLTRDQSFVSTGSGAIDFTQIINGAHALTASTGGALTFGGAIGGTTALTSLSATGTGISLGANVTTSGDQTYTGAVALTGDATVHSTGSGAVDFTSTINGAHALTVNTGGAATFGGAVGGATQLTSLDATWGSVTLSGNVTTTGAQTYHSALTLSRDQTFTTTGSGAVDFVSTINGAHALTVNAGGLVTLHAVGGATALTSLDATGSSLAVTGDISTTGAQYFHSPVTLAADVSLSSSAGGTLTFASTVDGNHAFNVNTSGLVRFHGVIGGATPVGDVNASGGSIEIGGDITSVGDQTYYGPVTLTADASLASNGSGTLLFNSTVDGAYALTVNTAGSLSFNDTVGGVTPLASLDATWGSITLTGDVTTTGAQAYHSALTLTQDETLTSTGSGAISFDSTIDGGYGLTVASTGGALTFSDVIGGSTPLASLAATGASISLSGGAATTTGNQTYTGATTLGADTTLAGALVSFTSTVDSDSTARRLTVTGDGSFGGAVGGGAALSALSVSGTAALGGDVTTTGDQTYSGAATLTGDAALTGGAIDFASTLDGAQNLTVNASGLLTFGDTVGGSTPLTSLTASWGSIALGGDVTTTGDQTYNSALTLTRTQIFTSTNPGLVTFNSTVDGAHIFAVTGNASFGDVVGGTAALSNLTVSGTAALNGGAVTTAGGQTYSGAVTLGAGTTLTGSAIGFSSTLNGAQILTVTGNGSFGGAVGGSTALTGLSVSGTSAIGANITTTGDQTYTGAVTLTGDAVLHSSGAGALDFVSTIDGAHALTVNTGGALTFGGAVGGATPLSSLSATWGTFALNGDVTTTGNQTYNSALTLTRAQTFTSTTPGLVRFVSTVDGGQTLTVTGNGRFDGAVGGTTALTSVSVSGTSVFNGLTVHTSGAQTYSGAATLLADAGLTGSLVRFGSTLDGGYNLTVTGGGRFDGAVGATTALASVSVSGASTLNGPSVHTVGTQTYSGATTLLTDTGLTGSLVRFGSTVDGAHALTVTGAGRFDGAVGGATALTTVAVSGASTLNGSTVHTTGSQTYSGAASLLTGAGLTGSLVSFGSTVDGAQVLTITGAGSFGGAVGGSTALTGLSVSGTTALNGGVVHTVGTQTYSGAATLGANAALTGSLISFGATVNGAYLLGVTGNGSFGGAVGGTTALAGLTVSGTSALNGGSVITTGGQTYSGAASLGVDTALTGSLVSFGGALNGAHILGITGNGGFGGAVGASTALTSLTVSGTSALNGGAVTTTGGQTYTGAATLGADAALTGSSVSFGSTLNGGYLVSVTGAASFGGAVGGATALSGLTVSGASALNGGAVTTVGGQSYSGAATLGVDNTLTGSLVSFGGAVNGAHALAVAGNAAFGGAVGATTALTSVSVSGTSALNGGGVTTTGGQTYAGAASLGVDTTLRSTNSGALSLASTVNGAHALSVNSGGAVSFGGAVGGSTPLTSLTASGATISAGAITTTGDVALQAADAVTLASVSAGDDLIVRAGGAVTASGALLSGQTASADSSGVGDVLFTAAPSSAFGTAYANVTGGGVLDIKTPGAITLNGFVSAGSAAGANADVRLNAGGAVQTASITANRDLQIDGSSVTGGALTAVNRDLAVRAGAGAISLGALAAGDDVVLRASAGVTTGTLNAGTKTDAAGVADTLAATALISASADPASAATALTLTGGVADIKSGGAIALGAATVGSLQAQAATSLTTGAVTASTGVFARSATVTLGGAWTTPSIQLEAANSAGLGLGDASGAAAGGYLIGNTAFQNLKAASIRIYAGDTTASGRYAVNLGALSVDDSKIATLAVYTGAAAKVSVTGAVAPVTGAANSTVLKIGAASTAGGVDWTPGSVLILNDGGAAAGSLGAGTDARTIDPTTVRAFKSVELNAVHDVLMGSQTFMTLIGNTPAAQVTAVLGTQAPVVRNGAPVLYLTSGALTIRANGKVVEQNSSGPTGGAYTGIFLTGAGVDTGLPASNLVAGSGTVLAIGRTDGGATAGTPQTTPDLVELYMNMVGPDGAQYPGTAVAVSPRIGFGGGVTSSQFYRVNTCVIGQQGNCTPLASPNTNLRPIDLSLISLLRQSPVPDVEDPTITGGSNEEIWRKPD